MKAAVCSYLSIIAAVYGELYHSDLDFQIHLCLLSFSILHALSSKLGCTYRGALELDDPDKDGRDARMLNNLFDFNGYVDQRFLYNKK